MIVAGFNLGSRFTLDDLSTASDIIHGNIKISLGSLDEEQEQEIKKEKLRMLDELEKIRKEMVNKDGGGSGESDKIFGKDEVRALEDSIGEKNKGTVGKFSDKENIKNNEGIIYGVGSSDRETKEKSCNYENKMGVHKEKENVNHREVTSVQNKGTYNINKVINNCESSKVRNNVDINRDIHKDKVRVLKENIKAVEKDVNSIDSENKSLYAKKRSSDSKEGNNKVKGKINYNELTLQEINDKYLRKFMIDNGVRKGTVEASIIINEFGSDIVRKLQLNGYIIKRGKGFIMGI